MSKGIRLPSSKKEVRRVLERLSYEEIVRVARSSPGRTEGEEMNNYLMRITCRKEARKMIEEGYASYTEFQKDSTSTDPIAGYALREIDGEWKQVSKKEYIDKQREIFGKVDKVYKAFGGEGIIGYAFQASEMVDVNTTEREVEKLKMDVRNQFYPDL